MHASQRARKTGCLSINLLVLSLTEGCRGGRSLSGTPCSLCPMPLAESQEFATGSVWCMEVHTEPSGESGVSAAGTQSVLFPRVDAAPEVWSGARQALSLNVY